MYNIKVSINTSYNVKAVKLVPQKQNIDYQLNNGIIEFVVPKINGHQMIASE